MRALAARPLSWLDGTLTDLRQAASVLAGRKVADGVRYIVVPATQRIFRSALQEGLIDALVAAGVVISPSTCGACAGLHMGVMTDGEVTMATTNVRLASTLRTGAACCVEYGSTPVSAS